MAHQFPLGIPRRIPTQSGGGANMMDATYNPLAQMEDYFFPVTADNRGSSVDTLQGASNLGEITDLRYFTNKLFRGLRIPSSYLPVAVEDSTQSYNYGRVGTALIQEFAQDKRDVVETKVRLVREAREKLETLKTRFVKESAEKMSQAVSRHLKSELNQLQEDIKIARENSFGRRIFEAYAAEFGATHLNEKAEVRKLYSALQNKDQQLAEAIKLSEKARAVVESKERELRVIKESNERETTMRELLSPLNREKADVMRNLLESVQTSRLKNAFEKYLPAVLEDRSVKAKPVITESVSAVTGDKTVPKQTTEEDRSNVIDLKRLAGL